MNSVEPSTRQPSHPIDIALGVVYDTNWSKTSLRRIGLPAAPGAPGNPPIQFFEGGFVTGPATLELIEDDLDIAIVNTSKISGESKMLHLEDLEVGDMFNKDSEKHLEISIFCYILQHRKNYAQNIFMTNGLRPVEFKDSQIVDIDLKDSGISGTPMLSKAYFISASQESEGNRNFAYLFFSENSFRYHPHEFQWELRLNASPQVIRSVAWNDEEGLIGLANLVSMGTESIETIFALGYPIMASKRTEMFKEYETEKEYSLVDEEEVLILNKLENYKKEVSLLDSYKNLDFDFQLTQRDLGPRYPAYTMGIRIQIKINSDSLPVELVNSHPGGQDGEYYAKIKEEIDIVKVKEEIIIAMRSIFDSFKMGLSFQKQYDLEDDRVILLCMTKQVYAFLANPPKNSLDIEAMLEIGNYWAYLNSGLGPIRTFNQSIYPLNVDSLNNGSISKDERVKTGYRHNS